MQKDENFKKNHKKEFSLTIKIKIQQFIIMERRKEQKECQ